jgi:hypothetical protein
MKFAKATLAALAVASASETESFETVGLSSHMQLVSRALEMGGSRTAAKALLHSALETFEGSHSRAHAGVRMMNDAATLEAHSQLVAVPIDEKLALTVKVSPTYALDEIQSVTLKAFRKIVGYDTFDSIRRKERSEQKDTSDYYNVTVSMMVKRKPVEAAAAPAAAHATSLAATLDKGFPYDD